MGKKKSKKKSKAAGAVPLGTKMQYVGVGFVLGVASSPTVRRWIERARPEVDRMLERLTTRAEEIAENAGDWMASARAQVAADGAKREQDPHEGHGHGHGRDAS